MTYEELISDIQDENNPLFGGSIAYLQLELNLALLIKLLKIKCKKATDQLNSYRKIISISKIIGEQSHKMIDEDGKIFQSLRTAKTQEEKDQIVDGVFPSSIAFLENLSTINLYLAGLIDETTSSLKYDFIMVKDSIQACKENLKHILMFEVRKTTDSETKDERFGIISALK